MDNITHITFKTLQLCLRKYFWRSFAASGTTGSSKACDEEQTRNVLPSVAQAHQYML